MTLVGFDPKRVAPRTRLLVVDDDDALRDLLSMALRHGGYDVDVAADLATARAIIARDPPPLLVLDVMLPDGDGIEFCSRLRRDGYRGQVLILTALDATADKVRGLTIGGDDYLTKPFSIEELTARLALMDRRVRDDPSAGVVYSFSDVRLDDARHQVTRDGSIIELTVTEFKLLRFFLTNPEQVLSKAQLIDHVWDYDFSGDVNIVETYISYLRRKLDRLGPPLIHTVRGVGYRLSVR